MLGNEKLSIKTYYIATAFSLLCMQGVVIGRPESTTAIAINSIIPILQYNETSIYTYRGKMHRTEYNLVRRDEEHKYLRPNTVPVVMREIDVDFIHDRTRGEDYWTSMTSFSSRSVYEFPTIVERRSGNIVQTLLIDQLKSPSLGIIDRPLNARCLGNSPRNFRCNTDIYILTSADEQGFVSSPLSELLSTGRAWLYRGEEEVEGYSCVKLAVLYSSVNLGRIAYVWLGKDINLNIVKQHTLPIESKLLNNFDEYADKYYNSNIYDMLDDLETRTPSSLVVCKDYINLGQNIWVPKTTKSYGLRPLNKLNVASTEYLEELSNAATKDTHTALFKDTAYTAYFTFVLDMNSVEINIPIDPEIFEDSIIPKGIPVSDFLHNIHPKDCERINKDMLDSLHADAGNRAKDVYSRDANMPSVSGTGQAGNRKEEDMPQKTETKGISLQIQKQAAPVSKEQKIANTLRRFMSLKILIIGTAILFTVLIFYVMKRKQRNT